MYYSTVKKAAHDSAGESLINSLLHVAHDLQARMETALQELGLSGAKYWALRQLAQSAQPLTLRELAEGQKCAPSNITQLVDRLEADGFVRRIDEPQDRRSKRAELTALGIEKQAAGAKAVAKVQSAFLATLSGADREALARGLAGAR